MAATADVAGVVRVDNRLTLQPSAEDRERC
jgi:hypothetical protein